MVAIFVGLGAGFERGSRAALGASGLLGSGVQGRAGDAVSLNAANGNLIVSQQDEFLAGLGPDVAIGRTYNSQGALNENGDGWRQSTDRRVYNLTGTLNTTGSTVTRVSADGSEIVYTYDATRAAYVSTDGAGAYDRLAYTAPVAGPPFVDGYWTWTDGASQFTETYLNADGGYISKYSDTDGNALRFTYASAGKLDKVTTQNGEYVQYSWSGNDITAIVTHFGTSSTITRATYGYDAQHRLTTVTVDLTPENTSDASTYTTTYAYVGTTNYLASITQSDGSSLTIQYNDTAHPTSVTDLIQLAASGDSRTTHIDYVSATRTDVTDPRGAITSLTYNAAGQLTQVTAPPAYAGATAQTVAYTYDANGNVLTVTDPTSAVTTYTYDANGNVASITDANGSVVSRSYNAKNALVMETRTASTAGSAAETVYTRYVYDDEDHLRFVISGAGRVTEYQYWANGSPADGSLKYTIDYPDSFYTSMAAPAVPAEADMIAWAGALDRTDAEICYYDYDARGDLSLSKHYGAASSTGAGLDSEGYNQTVFVYNQAGRLLQRTQGPQATEYFVYDGLGRLTSSTDLNGGTTTIAFNDGATTTTVTTAAGLSTVSTYNKAGDLLSSQVSGANTTGGTEYFTYDKDGQLRRSIDASGKIHYFLYDKVGRKVADIGANGEIVEYKYDQDGRLIASVRYANLLNSGDLSALASNPLTEFDMDAIHRPAASANDLWSWTVYDAGGRIIETIAGDGAATKYEYDASNQLVKTTSFVTKLSVSGFIASPPASASYPTSDAGDRITRSFYGSDGLLVGTLNAEGFFTRFYYDAASRKTQVTSFANRPAGAPATDSLNTIMGNITSDAARDVSTHFIYDGQGLLRFTIDALNHVTELVYRQSDNSYAIGLTRKTIEYATALGALSSYAYANVKAAVAAFGPNANDRVSYAVYNSKGQLAYTIDATGAVVGFAYDVMGRVIKTTQYAALNSTGVSATADSAWVSTMDTWAASQASNTANRVTRTWYSERGEALYVLDAEGYLSQNEYDPEGRLVKQHRYADRPNTAGAPLAITDATTIANLAASSKGADAVIAYAYDSFGRVSDIQDQLDVHTTRTYYANGLLQDEVRAAGSGSTESKTRRTYDQAGQLLSVTTAYGAAEAATTSYAYDGLGNVSAITDARGNVTAFTYDKLARVLTRTDPAGGVTSYQYDSFGNAVKTTDARGVVSFAYYDQINRVILTIDAAGYASETTYSAFGEVAGLTRRAIATTGATVSAKPAITTDSVHDETTAFAYDKLGRLTLITDALSQTTQYQLNAFGQVVKTTDPRGNASYRYYDRLGQATLAIDAEGYATEWTYTGRGQVATEKRRAVKATGIGDVNVRPTLTNDALDGVTSFTYDTAGRLTDQTSPVGIVTHYDYDVRGNRTAMTEAYGLTEHRVTQYQYDKLDRLTDVIGDGVYVTTSATAAQSASLVHPTTHYDYDANGNVIAVTDPVGAKTLNWYDSRNLLIWQVAPPNAATGLSTVTKYSYDADGNVTEKRLFATQITQSANALGAAPSVSNASGDRVTQYVYDALNRVTQTKIPSIEVASYASSFGVATQDLVTSIQYDAMGNVVKTTDANNNVTWCYYDKLNRKVAQFDGLNYRTDWSYDADGNVTSEKRYANAGTSTGSSAPVTAGVLPANLPTADAANDRTTSFTYDKMGRRLTETRANVAINNTASPGTTTTVNATVAYTYNALGEVATKTESTGDVTSYAYDTSGRMTSETHASFTGYTTSGSHSVTPTTTYVYDGLNDLVRTVQSGDSAASAADRTTQYTYGAGGRLASITDAEGFVHTYRYDAAGRVTRDEYARQLANGATAHEAKGSDYDLEGRVIRQGVLVDLDSGTSDTWSRAGAAIDTVSIKYNAFGEVAQRGQIHYSTADNSVSSELYPESFEYDGAGRLWRTTSGDGASKYFMYDAAGNQTLMVASTGTDISAGAGYSNIDAVLNLWGATRSAIATAPLSGVVATITRYDAKNQAIEVKEPQRELNATSTRYDLSTTRAYNAFGEVAYEVNALGNRIDYSYNTMGRLVQVQSPTVSITSAAGAVSSVRPTENYYYDASGRRVAARDANGNLTQYTLLAGSGYNGRDAIVAQTTFADSYAITTSYDIFGDARKITDQLSRVTTQSFDKLGRLTQVTHASGLVDYYQYDGFGQRIKAWNSQLGSANAATTTFDAQGRVTQAVAMGGDTTSYSYAWDASIATTGLATFGGWTQTTTLANGKTRTDKSDYFDRTIYASDYGAHVSTYTFDKAGRLVQRAGGWELNFTYYNTGRLSSEYQTSYAQTLGDDHYDYELRKTVFSYDAVGDLLTEKFTDDGNYWTWQLMGPPGEQEIHYFNHNFAYVFENATATYDALGRLSTWNEAGSTEVPVASASYYYDANGNVRRSTVVTRSIDGQGAATTTNVTQDYWYKYDPLNRMVIAKGVLSGGAISRGSTGIDIYYDQAGQRAYSLEAIQSTWIGGTVTNTRREDYTYDNAGRLTQVKSVDGTVNNITGAVTQPSGPGALRGAYGYDLMGHVLTEYNYNSSGSTVYSRADTFNDKGQITNEETHVIRSGTDYKAVTTFALTDASGNYFLGSPYKITTVNYENGTQKKTNVSVNTYVWWDAAMQGQVDYTPDFTGAPGTVNHSYYNYSNNGGDPFWSGVNIVDGRSRTVTFRTDLNGQVIRRDEADANTSNGDPHEIWYRFGGKQLAYVGNNNTITTDYVTSVNNRTTAQGTGAYMNGSGSMTLVTDTDQGYDPLNSYDSGSNEGLYTVQAGDTLSGIAAQLWGDSSLWYKLAEINGLSGDESLIEGTTLMIPPGVVRSTYTASTFTPYDPNDVIGNTAPTAVKPPKSGHGCGIAQIILVVIAVAVAVVTAGAAVAAMAPGGMTLGAGIGTVLGGGMAGAVGTPMALAIGAASGAAGSIVSQGIGVMTGIQDKFSWSAVGLAAIAGAIGGGGGKLGVGGSDWTAAAARGAISSALTQGVGVVTGLQDHFSWAGVAGAAVGAAVGSAFGGAMHLDKLAPTSVSGVIYGAATNTAGAIANAATRSLIDGSDFGDNVLAAIPDAIGQTIGSMIAGKIAEAGQRSRLNSAFKEAASDPSVQSAVQNLAANDPEARAALEQAQYDPNRPLTPQQLVNLLNANTSGLSAQDTIARIRDNITGFIDQAKQASIQAGHRDAIDTALAQNSALVATYSALGLTMPNFQWTYVGAFMAYQVREQLLSVHTLAEAGGLAAAPVVGPLSIPASRIAGDHIINTIIAGQIGVVTDIGSLALAYRDVGSRILSALPEGSSGYRGFQSQIQADAAAARGDYAAAGLAGRDAAIQLGIREQTYLQGMWNDPVLKFAAQTQQTLHLMDTTVHTPIGDIVAPRGADDVTNLNDRIAIAVNAFDFMYQHLYTGDTRASWAAVNRTLAGRMNSATLPQRPNILGIPI